MSDEQHEEPAATEADREYAPRSQGGHLVVISRESVENTEHYMASSSQLEQRVANLEAEVATLKRKLDKLDRATPWWEQIAGTFENDPIYEKAMQLGREYRQSLRPKTVPRRKQ
jgi:HD superfamily phosphodiesterase